MNAKDSMLCWTPDTYQVAIVPWPDRAGRSDRYDMTTLACNAEVQRMSFKERQALVFIEAMHLIVRDGMNPLEVHTALLQLDEYRAGCAQCMPGIEQARARFDADGERK
jgi:hypothetical protein